MFVFATGHCFDYWNVYDLVCVLNITGKTEMGDVREFKIDMAYKSCNLRTKTGTNVSCHLGVCKIMRQNTNALHCWGICCLTLRRFQSVGIRFVYVRLVHGVNEMKENEWSTCKERCSVRDAWKCGIFWQPIFTLSVQARVLLPFSLKNHVTLCVTFFHKSGLMSLELMILSR